METTAQLERGKGPTIYGLVAEFATPEDLLAATRLAREAGYRRMDAYTPFPVEDLSEELGHRDKFVPYIMLAGGLIGGIGGFGFLTWATAIDYKMNIGGRPLFAWPSFIPITFELTVLLAALSGIAGMIMLNGLPEPYHPVFAASNFHRASSDRFFLAIEARDPRYDSAETRAFLENLNTLGVEEVEGAD